MRRGNSTDFHTKKRLIFVQKIGSKICIFLFVFLDLLTNECFPASFKIS